jgi:hypothetical protein
VRLHVHYERFGFLLGDFVPSLDWNMMPMAEDGAHNNRNE